MNTWTASLLAFLTGAIFILVGYPLWRERVKPNLIYGFRTRQTLDDPAIWNPVNARSGRHLLVTGTILLLLGVVSIVFAHNEARQTAVVFVVVAVCIVGPIYSLIVCTRMARQLAEEKGT